MAADDLVRDAFLRHALRLDGLSRAVAADMARDVSRALALVEARLRQSPGDFTRARLVSLRGELAVLEEALAERLAVSAQAASEAAASTAPAAVEQAAGALGVSFTRPPVDLLAQVSARPFDGRSWRSWGRKLSRDTTDRVASELRQGILLGEGTPGLSARVAKVTGLARSRAETLARTAVSDVGNRARVASAREGFGPQVQGWRFLATLDGRTSLICAGLDGRTWPEGDEGIQRPPLHPACRSVLVPVTDLNAPPAGDRPEVQDTRTPKQRERDFRADARSRVGVERWRMHSEARRRELVAAERARWRRSRVGQVSAAREFEDWFASQPRSFQRDYLGPTRFRAFERGLPLDAMATNSRPLNLADLADRYPTELAP